jgi:ribosomal protein S18 acetylase RimI-like enzyme
MPSAEAGRFWKTPFVCLSERWRMPAPQRLQFEDAEEAWLREALRRTIAASLSESDRCLVERVGPDRVADELLSLAASHFMRPAHWWRMARNDQGEAIGFVLPVLFKKPEPDPRGMHRPEGTIFHMGVLPGFRGQGYALDLIIEATRICIDAGCWRIFCDTASSNAPMLSAFRQAGYEELTPWQQPLG